jgi:membrane protein implicated in regulation of membrane protease activity
MKPFTKITAFILTLIALLNLARVFLDIHIEVFSVAIWVGYIKIPMWVSIVVFILASVLSVGLWRESK